MIQKTTLPVQVISIEESGYHLLVKVKVNGKAAIMLIDTGASRTVFDKEKIVSFIGEKKFRPLEKLSAGLGTAKMETHSITLKKFQLGKLSLSDFEAIVVDLSHVNKTYERLELHEIDGVLGSDLMTDYDAVLDYRKKELKLRPKK